jgi:hypothetical protein
MNRKFRDRSGIFHVERSEIFIGIDGGTFGAPPEAAVKNFDTLRRFRKEF